MGPRLSSPRLYDARTYHVGTIGAWSCVIERRSHVYLIQSGSYVTVYVKGFAGVEIDNIDCSFTTVRSDMLNTNAILVTTDKGDRIVVNHYYSPDSECYCLDVRRHSSLTQSA